MTGPTRPDDETSSTRLGRRGLLAALGTVAVGAAVPERATAARSAIWPQYQYDGANTGTAAGLQGPTGSAGARWGYLDGGSFQTTPVVTDATVFAADEDGAVVAVDRTSGDERWRVETPTDTARLTYHDGLLLVPAEELEARSPADGSLQWSVRLTNPSGVTVMDDNAYVAAGGGVSRVSLGAQTVDWTVGRVTQVTHSVAVTDGYIFAIGSQYGKAIALDPAGGGRRWFRRLDGGGTGAPTYHDKRVYMPTDEGLWALGYESGVPRWSFEEAVGSSVAVADGTVYATTTGGELVALEAESGEEQWRRSPVNGSTSPVVAGGVLYVTGTDGTIAAVNPSNAQTLWSATVGGARRANVAVGAGELYVGDDDGRLAAVAQGASGGLTEETEQPASTADQDDGSNGGGGATATPTSTGGPGFGVAAGAAALGGGALAARRWLGGDGDPEERRE